MQSQIEGQTLVLDVLPFTNFASNKVIVTTIKISFTFNNINDTDKLKKSTDKFMFMAILVNSRSFQVSSHPSRSCECIYDTRSTRFSSFLLLFVPKFFKMYYTSFFVH